MSPLSPRLCYKILLTSSTSEGRIICNLKKVMSYISLFKDFTIELKYIIFK